MGPQSATKVPMLQKGLSNLDEAGKQHVVGHITPGDESKILELSSSRPLLFFPNHLVCLSASRFRTAGVLFVLGATFPFAVARSARRLVAGAPGVPDKVL